MATIDEVKAELEMRGARAWAVGFGVRRVAWMVGNDWDNRRYADVDAWEDASTAVDRIWPESVARDVPEEIHHVVCAHMTPDCRWSRIECVAGKWAHYRITLPLSEDRCRVFHDEIRKYVPASWCTEVVSGIEPSKPPRMLPRRRLPKPQQVASELFKRGASDVLVEFNQSSVRLKWEHNGGQFHRGIKPPPDTDRVTPQQIVDMAWPESAGRKTEAVQPVTCAKDINRLVRGLLPNVDVSIREPTPGHVSVQVDATEQTAEWLQREINRRIPASISCGVTGVRAEMTCADCGSIMGATCPCASDSLPAAGANEVDDFTESDCQRILDESAKRPIDLSKIVSVGILKKDAKPITVTSADQYRMLYGKEPPPGMFETPVLQQGLRPPEYVPMSPHTFREAQRLLSQKPLPPLNFAHPEPETAEQWASRNSDPVDDMQRGLDRYKQRNAPPTPEGITDLIRSGIAPHEYPHRTGKIELGSHGDCRCILCALPRGKSWGEVELQRRIEWMGQQVHDSLHAVGVWIHRGRTIGGEKGATNGK